MSNSISQDIDLNLLNSSESESGSLNGVEAPEEAEIQVLHETGPEVEVISGPTPVIRARAQRGPPGYEVVGARALEDAPTQPRDGERDRYETTATGATNGSNGGRSGPDGGLTKAVGTAIRGRENGGAIGGATPGGTDPKKIHLTEGTIINDNLLIPDKDACENQYLLDVFNRQNFSLENTYIEKLDSSERSMMTNHQI